MSLKKYRLTSMKEPTDKQLGSLMKEAIKDVRKRALTAKRLTAKKLGQEIARIKTKSKSKND